MKTRSPRAAWKPAVRAAALPKLRRNRIARTRGSRPASAARTAHEPSRLPSSTKMNSTGPRAPPANTASSSPWSAARLSSSS